MLATVLVILKLETELDGSFSRLISASLFARISFVNVCRYASGQVLLFYSLLYSIFSKITNA